jgi:AcrR family transcriptional regulator
MDNMRASIINAAGDIFSRYGYKKTTMDDIALALGKGKSSIYYYYRNKEEILQAVLEQETVLLKSKLQKAVNRKKHPKGKLKAYIITRTKEFENMINFNNAVKNEYLSQFEFIKHLRQKYDQEEIATIQLILQEGFESVVFRIGDTNLAAFAILTSLKGLEIPLYPEHVPEQVADKFLKILFNGILNV